MALFPLGIHFANKSNYFPWQRDWLTKGPFSFECNVDKHGVCKFKVIICASRIRAFELLVVGLFFSWKLLPAYFSCNFWFLRLWNQGQQVHCCIAHLAKTELCLFTSMSFQLKISFNWFGMGSWLAFVDIDSGVSGVSSNRFIAWLL